MTIFGKSCIEIKTLRYFGLRSSALESKTKKHPQQNGQTKD